MKLPLPLVFGLGLCGSMANAGVEASEFQRLVASYGNLITIAGTGYYENSNDWLPEFEGAKATEAELSNPHMCMADAAGNYYIADKESHSVLKVTPEGKIRTFAGTHEPATNHEQGEATQVELASPNGLYVLPNGIVYILDFFKGRVRRVSPSGILTTVFSDNEGFGEGRGLWVSPDETLIYYCGPGSVQRWTPGGKKKTIVSGLSDPGNIDVDPQGRVVVTDRVENRVYRIEASGKKTLIAGNGETGESDGEVPATECPLDQVRGVAFLPNGAYFLCTMKGGDIWYVDTSGIIHRFLSGTGKGNYHEGEDEPFWTEGDKISEPRAVTLAPNGDLIITTNDTGFIRVVKKLPPPPPQLSIRADASNLRVTWKAESGRAYLLEASSDLKQWSQMSAYSAKPEATVIDYAELLAGRRFFRVRAQ